MLCPTQLRSTVCVSGVPNVCCVANREDAKFLSLDKISIIKIHNMVDGCFSFLFYLFNFHLLAVLNTDTTTLEKQLISGSTSASQICQSGSIIENIESVHVHKLNTGSGLGEQ